MPTSKEQVEKDMLHYLQTKYKEAFLLKKCHWIANVGNFKNKDIHELVLAPKNNPTLHFYAKAGYGSDNTFFVSYEYYKTVKLAQAANEYAQNIISAQYPTFASHVALTNIQLILDTIPLDAIDYENIVRDHPQNIRTVLSVAIPSSPQKSRQEHLNHFKNLLRAYRDRGHQIFKIILVFYDAGVTENFKTNPSSFFDPNAPQLQRFKYKDNLVETWQFGFGVRTMPKMEQYLEDIENLMIVRKY